MSSKRPRVVLLHSAIGDSRLWRRQVAALEGRFDVVAPDLPGFGQTPEPSEPFSLVEQVLPHLPGMLVGNSMGGRLALWTALAHPDLVQRLVLVDAGLPDWEWSDEIRDYWKREEEAADRGDLDGAVEINLDFWVAPEFRDEIRPQVLRAFELQTAHEEPEVLWPDTPPIESLQVPTLVVIGDRDKQDFQDIGRHLAGRIPNARLEVVEGAGHLVGVDRPDQLNALLLDFLGDG